MAPLFTWTCAVTFYREGYMQTRVKRSAQNDTLAFRKRLFAFRTVSHNFSSFLSAPPTVCLHGGPCALVRRARVSREPCVSRVCPGSPRCLFTGVCLVFVPAPPGVFEPWLCGKSETKT